MDLELGELVEIEWFDAWADHEQSRPDQWGDEFINRLVGWVTRITDDVISISQEAMATEDEWRCTSHIPFVLIKEVKRLEYARKQTASYQGTRTQPAPTGSGDTTEQIITSLAAFRNDPTSIR